MTELLIPWILGMVTAFLGGLISYLFSRSKYLLEIQELKARLSMRDLEQEKERLEVEKLRIEVSILKRQEMKLLTDEFWNKLGAQAGELSPDSRQISGPILKAAFLALKESDEGLTNPNEPSVDSLSLRYQGRKLPGNELVRALSEIDCYSEELGAREHQAYARYHALDNLPYDERRKAREPLEQERERLQVLARRLDALKRDILRASLMPGLVLPGVDLSASDLAGMDLRRVKLFDADLRKARLQLSNLEGANLEGATLYYANLAGANLQGACLRKAKLDPADLREANLVGADLSGARLNKETLFTGAKYRQSGSRHEDTKWPDGFDPEAAGCVHQVEVP